MVTEWHGRFFANRYRRFVKGGPLWWRHRTQWCVYMEEFWPSAIDNTGFYATYPIPMVLLTHSTFIFYPHMQVAMEHNSNIHVLTGLFPCHRTGSD